MNIVPQWVIEKKRDHGALSEQEIQAFIAGYTAGDIPDYQAAALAMAIYLNGMDAVETAALTLAMMHSGEVLDTSALGRPVIDKHSTGGIGDKTSLILAPIAACCGLAVPMISGRGLGITGGTLDKMEAIPGYRTDLSQAELMRVVGACGCAIIGQTANLAPADKKLYALRDVTATVPSIPLITASIMCKKLAEGLDGLVLDVKFGKGAFMKTIDEARALARSMFEVGREMGKGMTAVITSMDEPLGHTAGNALEVEECAACLRGEGPADLMEVTRVLTAHMLLLGGVAENEASALEQVDRCIASGEAHERFQTMVRLQGGDPEAIEREGGLCPASITEELCAETTGFVTEVDADAIGRGVLLLGAGREQSADPVDHATGVSRLIKTGTEVQAGDRLAILHANDPERLERARDYFRRAVVIRGQAPGAASRIHEVMT